MTRPLVEQLVAGLVSLLAVKIDRRRGLMPAELALLDDAEVDDVSFGWVLIHLGLRGNPPNTPDWRPGPEEIDAAFHALKRLRQLGLIRVGRLEYIDCGPDGHVAPVRHIEEPLPLVRQRVEAAATAEADSNSWEFACWVVATTAPAN